MMQNIYLQHDGTKLWFCDVMSQLLCAIRVKHTVLTWSNTEKSELLFHVFRFEITVFLDPCNKNLWPNTQGRIDGNIEVQLLILCFAFKVSQRGNTNNI